MNNEEKSLKIIDRLKSFFVEPIQPISALKIGIMEMAEWKDEGFLEWLKEIDTYSLKDKSRYIKLAIKNLEKKGGEK